jgi:hypothetical protein
LKISSLRVGVVRSKDVKSLPVVGCSLSIARPDGVNRSWLVAGELFNC